MTLDEALAATVEGARVTAPHMQPGCYVEHSLSRGFLRCWPVASAEDEPNRTQCEFRKNDLDEDAEWRVLEPSEQYPPKPKIIGGWAAVPGAAGYVVRKADSTEPWAKPLDPRKGGW